MDGNLVITNIMPGGPADGINSVMSGDMIIGIRGFLARALTPVQMAELAKGPAGTKLQLLLGAEYIGGKYSYTTQHVLSDGGQATVNRVKVISLSSPTPCRVEPETQLLSPGVAQGAMAPEDDDLPEDDEELAESVRRVRLSQAAEEAAEEAAQDAASEQREAAGDLLKQHARTPRQEVVKATEEVVKATEEVMVSVSAEAEEEVMVQVGSCQYDLNDYEAEDEDGTTSKYDLNDYEAEDDDVTTSTQETPRTSSST